MALKLKRGLEADRLLYTPQVGELVYTTDNKQIFVGDGTTAGGNPASGGGVVAGLSVPPSDPFYSEAQAALNDPFLDGNLHLRGNDIVGTGNINITGTITASGNVNIGDGGGGDTVSFAAGVTSNIVPETGSTYNLGAGDAAWLAVTAVTGNFSTVNAVTINTPADGGLFGNVIGEDSTVLVDYLNSSINASAISGTVSAALLGNVTGNVTGNLTGNVTLDAGYANDGTTVIIDGQLNAQGAATFFGELQGLLVGDVDGDMVGSVTSNDEALVMVDADAKTVEATTGTFGTVVSTTINSASTVGITGATGTTVTATAGSLTLAGQGLSLIDNGSGTTVTDTNGIVVTGSVDFSGATFAGTTTLGATVTGDLTVGGNLTATGSIAATTADTLSTPRTINGVGFDGSANISVEDNTKLPTSGAIPMLGALTLSGDPTTALHATTKQYVDGKFFDPTVNTTVSAAETTFANAIKVSDIQEETSGQGIAIASVNGNVAINAGIGTVALQNLAGGTVTISGLDIAGTNIGTTDSSSITIDNITTFVSDVTVDGRLSVDELDATNITTSGAGVPRLESDTNLEISVPNGQVKITDGLFTLAQYTLSGLGTDFTPASGDTAFVEDATLPQPHVYTAGMWMPMLSPTIGWTLGANGTTDFTFTGPGFTGTVNDPNFTVYRGHTYVFDNTANGASHPFNLQTSDPGVSGYSSGALYTTGTSGSIQGTYVWTVPMDAPTSLYYVCTNHGGAMYGTITVA